MSHTSRHKKHSGAFWHNHPQSEPEIAPKKGLDEYVDAHHSDTSSQGKRHDAIAGQTGTRTTPINRPALALAAYRHPNLLAQARTSLNGGKAFATLHDIADQIERAMSSEEIQRELSQYQALEKQLSVRPNIQSSFNLRNQHTNVSQPDPISQSHSNALEESSREYELFCETGQIKYFEKAAKKLAEWVDMLRERGNKMKNTRRKLACWLMEIGNAYRHCQYGINALDIEKAKWFYKKAAELGSVEAEVAINSMQDA